MSSKENLQSDAGLAAAAAEPAVRAYAARHRGDLLIARGIAAWIDNLLVLGAVGLGGAALSSTSGLGATVAFVVAVFVYHSAFEGAWGITVGKWCCGLRVVDESGVAPGLGRAAIRTLVRLVEVSPLLFGGLPAALIADRTRYRQRLGDLAARTFVLTLRDLRAGFPASIGARIPGHDGRWFVRRGA